VVVKFITKWSPACEDVKERYIDLAGDLKKIASLVELDVDEEINEDLIEKRQEGFISCVPTFYIYKFDKVEERVVKVDELKGLAQGSDLLKDLRDKIDYHREKEPESETKK
jgi:thiol-disulfide isomerase/thioredoxin